MLAAWLSARLLDYLERHKLTTLEQAQAVAEVALDLAEQASDAGCSREELETAGGVKRSTVLAHLKRLGAIKGSDDRYRLAAEVEA